MKSKEQLNTQIEQTVYPNTQGLIDAQKIQDLLKEVVDSGVNKMTDAPLDNKTYGLKNQQVVDIKIEDYLKSDIFTAFIANAATKYTVKAANTDSEVIPPYSFSGLSIDWSYPYKVNEDFNINGVALRNGDYCLIRNQNGEENINGVYEVINDGYDEMPIVITRVGQYDLVAEVNDSISQTYFRYTNTIHEVTFDNYKL